MVSIERKLEMYARTMLAGFSGVVQVEAYAGYNALARERNVLLAFRWAALELRQTYSGRGLRPPPYCQSAPSRFVTRRAGTHTDATSSIRLWRGRARRRARKQTQPQTQGRCYARPVMNFPGDNVRV
jgi:hypothetical protein